MQGERLELLARQAAEAKRAALRQLLAALAVGPPPALQSFMRDHPGPFARPSWVDEFLQAPDGFELDELDRTWRPLLRKLVARLAEGLPHDAELSSDDRGLVEDLAEWALRQLRRPAGSRDAPSAQVVRFLESARRLEIEARNAVAALVKYCYSLPEHDNPIVSSARKVAIGHHGALMEPDDLAGICIERLYHRIDQFRDADEGRFRAWIRTLVQNAVRSWYRQHRTWHRHHERIFVERSEISAPDLVVTATLQNEQTELSRTPFSASDWAVISRWADRNRNIKVPIVVIVGWNWWRKVAADAAHWECFSEWCRASGVDDVERLKDGLAALEHPTTRTLLQCLARRQGIPYNTTARLFHRPFSGISQPCRQTSFGKWHLVVELEFFWQLVFSGVVSQHDSQRVCDDLKPYDLHPRIAALLCAPAWPLVGSLHCWRNVSGDYPFLESPPLLEFLYRRYNLSDRDRSALPSDLQSDEAVWAYCRQVMLAHATKGSLDDVKQQVETARRRGAPLEDNLRKMWRNVHPA